LKYQPAVKTGRLPRGDSLQIKAGELLNEETAKKEYFLMGKFLMLILLLPV